LALESGNTYLESRIPCPIVAYAGDIPSGRRSPVPEQVAQKKFTVDDYAGAISAAMPKLDLTDQQIATQIHQLMSANEPVDPADVARNIGVPVELVNARLDSWPGGAVVSMVVPDAPFGYDVIEAFCSRVFFFASEATGARWAAEHPRTTILSVDEAFDVGRVLNEKTAPDLFGKKG
jgi:hypothetical protein